MSPLALPSVTAPSSVVAPVAFRSATVVLPLAAVTLKPEPTAKLVPLNVRLPSSSSSPLVPAITIRLSVRSLTFALARVAAVVAFTFSAKKSLATPRPPSIITAPVVLLVESVVLLKLAIPVASKVPATFVLPVAPATVNTSLGVPALSFIVKFAAAL